MASLPNYESGDSPVRLACAFAQATTTEGHVLARSLHSSQMINKAGICACTTSPCQAVQ